MKLSKYKILSSFLSSSLFFALFVKSLLRQQRRHLPLADP